MKPSDWFDTRSAKISGGRLPLKEFRSVGTCGRMWLPVMLYTIAWTLSFGKPFLKNSRVSTHGNMPRKGSCQMPQNDFSVYRKIEEDPLVAVHGQVFTRRHIVDFMLDVADYTPTRRLQNLSVLEPGCGDGAFLIPVALRLIASLGASRDYEALSRCILGVERDGRLVHSARVSMAGALIDAGVPTTAASRLSESWIINADFLGLRIDRRFDLVIGNPPYVRQEAIPKQLVDQYRSTFSCFYDRADLYVAFFEKGLRLISETGTLAFICPNRFTKNNYGRKLRALITGRFRLTHVIDLPEASPFEPSVLSYPGIYVVRAGEMDSVEHVRLTDATPKECETARRALRGERVISAGVTRHTYPNWFTGEQKWATHSPKHLELLRKIESECVALGNDASGCRVGIGVATGADDVFIVRKHDIDIEPELLMPLVTTRDIESGEVRWGGRYVINPFARSENGALIDLAGFPKARAYFEKHRAQLVKRNVSKRNLHGWYRTIDRIYPHLQSTPMLLIPDIKSSNTTIALETGELYPHHNLYFVTSRYWDLRALRAILRSEIARFFISMYGVKMRSGWFRFQAQYLRRICVPPLMMVPKSTLRQLARAGDNEEQAVVDDLVADVYGLSREDRRLIRSFEETAQPRSLNDPGE